MEALLLVFSLTCFLIAECNGIHLKLLPEDVIAKFEGEKVVVTCRISSEEKRRDNSSGKDNLVEIGHMLKWVSSKNVDVPQNDRVKVLQVEKDKGPQLSLIFSQIRRSDAGVYFCLGNNQEKPFKLIVRKHVVFKDTPIHQEAFEGNESFVIRCEADGDPKPTIRWQKKERTLDEPKYRQIEDGLVVNNITWNDAGNYTCLAIQTEIDHFEPRTINFVVNHKPRFPNGNTVVYGLNGTTVDLECPVQSYPPSQIQWLRYNETIHGENNNIFKVNIDNISLGEYQCIASNNLGNASLFIDLKLAKKPEQIKTTTIHAVAPNTIKLNITEVPPHVEDFKVIKYTVEVVERRKAKKQNTWHNARKFELLAGSPFILTNLTENTEYVIRLKAHNRFGEGEYSSNVHAKTMTTSSGHYFYRLPFIFYIVHIRFLNYLS